MEKDWSLLIKNYREKSKLTQRQLASISGLSQSQINRIECGKSKISIGCLEKLALAYDISFFDFIKTLVKGEKMGTKDFEKLFFELYVHHKFIISQYKDKLTNLERMLEITELDRRHFQCETLKLGHKLGLD